METPRSVIERDIKDIEHYLEQAERDPTIHNKAFLDHKRLRLEELKKQLQGFKND